MRSRRKNTRSSSGRASRGDTGSWLHCWASQSRYFLCRSSMIRLLRGESGPWNWLGGAFCPNRLNLYRLIAHGRTWIGIPGQAPRGIALTELGPGESKKGLASGGISCSEISDLGERDTDRIPTLPTESPGSSAATNGSRDHTSHPSKPTEM